MEPVKNLLNTVGGVSGGDVGGAVDGLGGTATSTVQGALSGITGAVDPTELTKCLSELPEDLVDQIEKAVDKVLGLLGGKQ